MAPSAGSGGGLFQRSGTATVAASTISGNSAAVHDTPFRYIDQGGGAGIFQNGGALTVTDSTIRDNTAMFNGGGVFRAGGWPLAIQSSTLSGNSASNGGGAYIVDWQSYHPVTAAIRNSTVSGNSASDSGGGVHNSYGPLTILDSTVSGNTATVGGGIISDYRGELALARSVISGNTATEGAELYKYNSSVTAGNWNLFGHDGSAGTFGFGASGSDIVPSQPLAEILGPLAPNGGPTNTHALAAGSPALDLVPLSDCVATDQRGVSRPQGPACDIGAFEREPAQPPFAFNGFFAPVSNNALNSVKAGQAIPVRFSLGGDKGLDIFDGGYPASQQVACDMSSGTSPLSETVNAGNSRLTYDAASDTYTFVWKTEKGWSTSCRRLVLRFTDGTTADAEFRFTK